jgi:hypothetical protein
VTWATWALAIASMATAVTNTVLIFAHGSADNARFAAHGDRLDRLENGRPT